ncbi:hypothetical protein D5018_09665 [Parashewanella curva]|uniref:Uncharacterized protein n=1 Tax=Parashewanella curva TaxID=2338552 RepID=A0A3L8PYM4_9GAMM|nr:hypothetical protein [Parashewanella curva]RLV59939.1 hypothetical protein D5018_09665 [Parashewanella curva]
MLDKFLTQLGEDTELCERYKKNPKEIMESYGLTDEEISAMLSGDLSKIKDSSNFQQTNFIIFILSPNEK